MSTTDTHRSATCTRCTGPAVASLATEWLCGPHYRHIVQPISERLARQGIDAATGADVDPVHLDAPLGWLVFDRPAPNWPHGYAWLRCDVCDYESVGRIRGALCAQCVRRGHRAEHDERRGRRPYDRLT